MDSFNMQDFNEILEKCRDQSQQKKQDQVKSESCHQSEIMNAGNCFSLSIFRHCFSRLCTFNKFLENKFAVSWLLPSTSGWTYQTTNFPQSQKSSKCYTILVYCEWHENCGSCMVLEIWNCHIASKIAESWNVSRQSFKHLSTIIVYIKITIRKKCAQGKTARCDWNWVQHRCMNW